MLQIKHKAKLFYADDTTIVIELHPSELELLNSLRNKWRFGEVTIIMRDGLPQRLKRVEEFLDLDKKEKEV